MSSSESSTHPGVWNWNDDISNAVGMDFTSQSPRENPLVVALRAQAERMSALNAAGCAPVTGNYALADDGTGGLSGICSIKYCQTYCIILAQEYLDVGNVTATPAVDGTPTTVVDDLTWAYNSTFDYVSLYKTPWAPKYIYDLRFNDWQKPWPGEHGWRRAAVREICTTDPSVAYVKGYSLTDETPETYVYPGPRIYTAFATPPEVGDVAQLIYVSNYQMYESYFYGDMSRQKQKGIDHYPDYVKHDKANVGNYFQWTGTAWKFYASSDDLAAKAAAIITDYGPVQLGDIVGTWNIEDINTAINLLCWTWIGNTCHYNVIGGYAYLALQRYSRLLTTRCRDRFAAAFRRWW